MNAIRIASAKSWTAALLASIATAAGTEVAKGIANLSFWMTLLIVAVFPAVSTLLVELIFRLLQGTKRGRRLLAGSDWIEGYWHIVTLSPDNDREPVSPGLMYVHYTGDDAHLSVTVFRRHDAGGQTVLKASESTLATFRESDHQFMNVCMQRYAEQEDKALGVGTFLPDGAEDYPTRYEGWMIRLTEGVYRIQVAYRLKDDLVAANQQKFGSDWIASTLHQLEHTSTAAPMQVQTTA